MSKLSKLCSMLAILTLAHVPSASAEFSFTGPYYLNIPVSKPVPPAQAVVRSQVRFYSDARNNHLLEVSGCRFQIISNTESIPDWHKSFIKGDTGSKYAIGITFIGAARVVGPINPSIAPRAPFECRSNTAPISVSVTAMIPKTGFRSTNALGANSKYKAQTEPLGLKKKILLRMAGGTATVEQARYALVPMSEDYFTPSQVEIGKNILLQILVEAFSKSKK